MRTKHLLFVSLDDQAYYMERITERWRLLGSSLENIRKNVARDIVVGELMAKEMDHAQDSRRMAPLAG